MGAEASTLQPGTYKCQDDPVSTGHHYSLYNCQDPHQEPLSLFTTSDFSPGCDLEKLSLRLKQYRHPNILHFISCPSKGSLVTERVTPLSLARADIEEESVCLGLLELCQALAFLHQAGLCHGNICQGSVFITREGRWRLGGLESSEPVNPGAVAKDVQALGLMITELLANCQLEESKTFTEYTKNNLLLPDIRRIPSADTILKNEYFTQPLPDIFKFLNNFPIQSPEARSEFFKTLSSRLSLLPPSVIGQELVPLMLTRYVMLDSLAHRHLIPRLLVPQSDQSLLPLPQYLTHVVPQLRLLLMVPDTTVRLTLLTHLPHIMKHLDQVTLTEFLPFILQGMRDTDPDIVSSTLRCLADLVPILGPEVVVGSNRTKIFSDRSPTKERKTYENTEPLVAPVKIIQEKMEKEVSEGDGGDDWDDWDEGEKEPEKTEKTENVENEDDSVHNKLNKLDWRGEESFKGVDITSNVAKLLKNVEELDIMKLDVKVSKLKSAKLEDGGGDIDYFADMTPQITREASSLDKFEAQLKSNTGLVSSSRTWNINYITVVFRRISLLWRLEMRVTMRMMDGERKTGDSLRSSLTVDSYLCEVFLEK